jgi:hypothetical protein
MPPTTRLEFPTGGIVPDARLAEIPRDHAHLPAGLIAFGPAFPPQHEDHLSVTITLESRPIPAVTRGIQRARLGFPRLARTED